MRFFLPRPRRALRTYTTFPHTLTEHGLIHSETPHLSAHLESAPRTVYTGFDPTSDSLHLGHLTILMTLVHFLRANHLPIVLLGGATGLIGDPSGRNTERTTLDPEIVDAHTQALQRSISAFFTHARERLGFSQKEKVVNNLEWFGRMNVLDFFSEVGNKARIATMMKRESVKSRKDHLSYNEFSYQLFQAYDFYQLHRREGCTVQIGGQDQWGNIVSGIDLVRRLTENEVYGMTLSLFLTDSGAKMSKSSGTALWLDPSKTRPYDFFQHFIRVPDQHVRMYLERFTFLEKAQREDILHLHQQHPEKRYAQKMVADEVTRFIHGEEGWKDAVHSTQLFFVQETKTTEHTNMPCFEISRKDLVGETLVEIGYRAGLARSKSQMRTLIRTGGCYLNQQPILEETYRIQEKDLSEGRLFLRRGKRDYVVVSVQETLVHPPQNLSLPVDE